MLYVYRCICSNRDKLVCDAEMQTIFCDSAMSHPHHLLIKFILQNSSSFCREQGGGGGVESQFALSSPVIVIFTVERVKCLGSQGALKIRGGGIFIMFIFTPCFSKCCRQTTDILYFLLCVFLCPTFFSAATFHSKPTQQITEDSRQREEGEGTPLTYLLNGYR